MDANNQALRNAVHRVANARLKAAAQNISRVANASKNGKIAELQRELENLKRTMPAASQAVAAAQAVAPEVQATQATHTAENLAVNAVNTLINKIGKGKYNNKLKENPYVNFSNENGYNAANKNNINRAAAARLATFNSP